MAALFCTTIANVQFFPVIDRMHAGNGRGQGLTLNSGTELVLLGIGACLAIWALSALTNVVKLRSTAIMICGSFVVWGLMTSIWSPNPILTAARILEFGVVVCTAVITTQFIVTAHRSSNSAATILARAFILSTLFLLIVNIIIWKTPIPIIGGVNGIQVHDQTVSADILAAYESDPDDHRTRTTLAYAHPLAAGNFFALTIICIMASSLSSTIKVIACPLAIFAIWMADARTALYVTPLVILLMLINKIKTYNVRLLVLSMSCIAMIWPIIYCSCVPAVSTADVDMGTLNGRTGLWEDVIKIVQDNWSTGTGYCASRFVLVTPARQWAEHAHNSFLEMALGAGIIGVVIYVLFVGYALRVIWQTQDELLSGVFIYCMAIGNINVITFVAGFEMFALLVALLSAQQSFTTLEIDQCQL